MRVAMILAAAAVALALCACEGYTKRPGLLEAVGVLPPPPTALTVMTFNIRYATPRDGPDAWENRRGLAAEAISSHHPDIVGLQEALRGQLDDLQHLLGGYAEVGVGRDDGRVAGEYAAILYNRDRFEEQARGTFWFSDSPEVPGSRTWGNTVPRICTWVRLSERPGPGVGLRGRAFYVYNVHLDHESEPSRQKSARLLAQRIASRSHAGDQVIVTGDFNAGEDSVAVRLMTGRAAGADSGAAAEPIAGWTGLVDAFRAAHPEATENLGTYHGFKGSASGERIDYVLVPRNAEVIDAEIDHRSSAGRYPSDHFPVVARVRLKD